MALHTTHHDVVVIGARCAGSSTARLLAARGYDVVVLERATLPSDTLSTHAIARGGVVQLARWGLLDKLLAGGAPPVRAVTFSSGGQERRVQVKDRAGVDLLLAPRRTVLDALLAEEAVAAGAALHTGTVATGLLRDDHGRVSGVLTRDRTGAQHVHRARLVVGADGLRSATARWADAPTQRYVEPRTSTWYAHVGGVGWDGFEFHVAPRAFAGVFPTHDDRACVWLSRPSPLLGTVRAAGPGRERALVDALQEVAPTIAERVRDGRVDGPVRGGVDLPDLVRVPHGPGWALVGDAGYHRDPITGHGITDAFRDAELLADAAHAVLAGNLPEAEAMGAYACARDAALAETFRLTRALKAYPHPTRFVALQKQLSDALEREASVLASRPAPAGLQAAPAA
ncbi:NAD(P)/FAD-dependent oxidoreductase [Nocardioides sp. MAHUQ-72]|uniref:NAD(P)/FAD-dependent oxidoreductase n=1 Tax=unclassified Nocardioides TaxID=2615069 RepID=UPI00360641A4